MANNDLHKLLHRSKSGFPETYIIHIYCLHALLKWKWGMLISCLPQQLQTLTRTILIVSLHDPTTQLLHLLLHVSSILSHRQHSMSYTQNYIFEQFYKHVTKGFTVDRDPKPPTRASLGWKSQGETPWVGQKKQLGEARGGGHPLLMVWVVMTHTVNKKLITITQFIQFHNWAWYFLLCYMPNTIY